MSVHLKSSLLSQIPLGFDLKRSGENSFVIRHKRTGMGSMNAFLITWFVGWAAGCIFLSNQYLNGESISLWLILAFWIVAIITAGFLLLLFFSEKVFFIDAENLRIEKEMFGFKQSKTIPKGSINRLIQVKDGGGEEDSFPSWGLQLEAGKNVTLIFRQPYDKSIWLGEVLAAWALVEFKKIAER